MGVLDCCVAVFMSKSACCICVCGNSYRQDVEGILDKYIYRS